MSASVIIPAVKMQAVPTPKGHTTAFAIRDILETENFA